MRNLAMAMAAVLFPASVCYGDALKIDQVSSSAKWLVHVDVDAFNASQTGALVKTEILAQHADRLEGIKTTFGFDPLQDIRALTLYGEDAARENAVVVARGRFDAEKLIALAKLNPAYEQIPYGALTIRKWHDAGKDGFGCFFAADTLILGGRLDVLRSALDVLGGTKPHLAADTGLGGMAAAANGAILFAAGDGLGGMQGMQPNAAILKNSQTASLRVSEVNGELQVEVSLAAPNAEKAEQVVNVLKGMIAAGLLAQDQNPVLARLAQAVRLNVEGSQIKLGLAVPVGDVAALIKAGKK